MLAMTDLLVHSLAHSITHSLARSLAHSQLMIKVTVILAVVLSEEISSCICVSSGQPCSFYMCCFPGFRHVNRSALLCTVLSGATMLKDKLSAAIQSGTHMHCASCRFDVLQEVATAADDSAGPEAALQIVHQLLSETLYVLHELLKSGCQSLVLPITQVLIHSLIDQLVGWLVDWLID